MNITAKNITKVSEVAKHILYCPKEFFQLFLEDQITQQVKLEPPYALGHP